MKKAVKAYPSLSPFKLDTSIALDILLNKYGITIHKQNIENYKQWMKKPFTGWVVGAKFIKNIDYEFLLIQDCILMNYKEVMNECVEDMRNHTSGQILRELNRPVQKGHFIMAKKMIKK
ncbi:MAG TPA: hypothetical protein VN721_12340 [Flavipsychrobacter sp.]|nr:hypothetical protein [Flavipsychrobacter sp.]